MPVYVTCLKGHLEESPKSYGFDDMGISCQLDDDVKLLIKLPSKIQLGFTIALIKEGYASPYDDSAKPPLLNGVAL